MNRHLRQCGTMLLAMILVLALLVNPALASSKPHSKHMRRPISWVKSSETVPYPELKGKPNLWVKVSLKGNRTYVYSGKKLLYTMYSSAGVYKKDPVTHKMKSVTPTGTFHASNIRKDRVYNPNLKLGANYCISWNGDYMFHSIVTTKDPHHYIKSLANKQGKAPSSPGCVCLSIADAKWFEHDLPTGTKVVVADN
ncbi:L,D-transpeptidase [Limosilactobacillus secaliphilus]|nr:L,D-transpeptidase [Limosilactobacillus secaliphilus]